MRARGFVLAFACAAATLACEAVPDLTFADAAADLDAADAAEDASDAGAAEDAALDGGLGCPTSPPPGASVCCGAIACEGLCASQCAMCMATCSPDALCCAKTNNVRCLRDGGVCH